MIKEEILIFNINMRIYNNTAAQVEFDLTPTRKIVIPSKAYSGDFLPNTAALDKLVLAFTPDQIAFLVGNAAELGLCSTTKCTTTGNYVCGSFDEISERFGLAKKEEKKPEPEAPKAEVEGAVLKEKVIEAAPVSEPVVEDTPVTEPEQPAKKSRKKKKD